MRKKIFQPCLIFFVLVFSPLTQADEKIAFGDNLYDFPSSGKQHNAQEDEKFSYQDLIRLGKEEIHLAHYQKAIFYFKLAHIADPASPEPRYYVNLAKRLQENRVRFLGVGVTQDSAVSVSRLRESAVPAKSTPSAPDLALPKPKSSVERFQEYPTKRSSREVFQDSYSQAPTASSLDLSLKRESLSSQDLPTTPRDVSASAGKSVQPVSGVPASQENLSGFISSTPTLIEPIVTDKKGVVSIARFRPPTAQQRASSPNTLAGLEEITLDDELKRAQPRTRIQIEINKSLVMAGKNIARYLIITPDIILIERVDKDRIRITGKSRGTTLLHVWDDQSRWTFQVEVVFPSSIEDETYAAQKIIQESEEPFRFFYTNDWNAFYNGGGAGTLSRRSLNFTQIPSIEGQTPYGRFDSYAIFNKFNESTEVTGYSVGLSDGHFGAFKNFNVRGYDLSKRFSPLTLPGKYVRGALLEGKAFDRNIEYTLLWGRDRLTYGFLGPGILERKESFVQGARMVLFPHQRREYAINYAQAYGSAREDYLKDRAISVETQQRFNVAERFQKLLLGKEVRFLSEIAFDEERFAKTAGTEFGQDNLKLRLNFRDIDRDYLNLSGNPPNQGELGGNAVLNWNLEKVDISSGLDVYRNRFIFNPDRPHAFNYDLNASLNFPLPEFSNFRTSLFYVNTPQEVSPRENFQLLNNYSRSFNILDNRPLSVFVGNSYQHNRYKLSPISDFDRYSMSTGFRVPLIQSLHYFFNYEFSWVEEPLTQDDSFPQVYNTGISYYKKLSDFWSGNLGFSYRNEENVEGLHSFLAGEDSIIGTMGFNFHPKDDFEFFVDSQFRNVWPESKSRDHYAEAEIRWGIRSAWDLPFHFNPKADVGGYVFKDLNGNALKDNEEPGISGVKVGIGKYQVKTDQQGRFGLKVSAKKVLVEVDTDSIPKGFVSTTPLFEEIEIQNHQIHKINFGLTTHSGISGVVYWDKNNNGKLDPEDTFIQRVKIKLDGKKTSVTDYEGAYYFDNVPPGEHTIRLDVNSLPLEYLPLIKLTNTFEVSEGQSYIFHIPVKQK